MRRLFLRKLKTELKIPVLALVDSDPYGLKILSVYMKGGAIHWNGSNITRSMCMLFYVQLVSYSCKCLDVCSQCAAGSMNMSYDSSNLTTPDIKVRPAPQTRQTVA